MPLNINPYEGQATAAVAGNRMGNLGLQVPDYGAFGKNYASSLLGQQQLQQQYAQLKAQSDLKYAEFNNNTVQKQLQAYFDMQKQKDQQVFDSGQNDQQRAVTLQNNLATQGSKQQELQQQGAYQQGELQSKAVQNQVLQNKNQVLAQNGALTYDAKQQELTQADQHWKEDIAVKQGQLHLNMMKQEGDSAIKTAGAASSVMLSTLETHDPSEWPKLIPSMLATAQKKFGLSDEVFSQLNDLGKDPAAFHLALQYNTVLAGHALGLDSKAADKLNQTTQQTATQAEGFVQSMGKVMDRAIELKKTMNPDLLTNPGKITTAIRSAAEQNPPIAGIIEGVAGAIPGLHYTPERAQQMVKDKAAMASEAAALKLNIMESLKKAGRYSPGMQKIYDSITPTQSDDNTTFVTKYDQLVNRGISDMQDVTSVLPANKAKTYNAMIQDKSQSFASITPKGSDTESKAYSYTDSKGQTTVIPKERINEIHKLNPGLSLDQIKQQLSGGK